MRREACAGNDAVLVDHAQGAEAHLRRVMIIGEGEAVPAVEPAGAAAAARHAITKGDHAMLLSARPLAADAARPRTGRARKMWRSPAAAQGAPGARLV